MKSTEPSIPAPARRVRTRTGIVAAAALACAALLSACGSSSTSTAKGLNVHQIEESIKDTIFEKRHLVATVTCPASPPHEKGDTFTCVATTHSPANPSKVVKTPFVVTVQTNKGYVTYVGR
jgi:hypothetical protein